jgi:hypothetical protein
MRSKMMLVITLIIFSFVYLNAMRLVPDTTIELLLDSVFKNAKINPSIYLETIFHGLYFSYSLVYVLAAGITLYLGKDILKGQ